MFSTRRRVSAGALGAPFFTRVPRLRKRSVASRKRAPEPLVQRARSLLCQFAHNRVKELSDSARALPGDGARLD